MNGISINPLDYGSGLRVPTSGFTLPNYGSGYTAPNYGLVPDVGIPTQGITPPEGFGLGNFANAPGVGSAAAGGGRDWMSLLLGEKGQMGLGQLGLGTMAGIGNMFLGMKQYGLAKDQFAENKRQYNQNYEAQKGLTNSQLADRQAARIAASGAAGRESVADYMAKYGVK